MKYLNLGCGARFNKKWTNIDFVSQGKHVISCDLKKGIPFPEYHFDVVYHSHLLEHIPRNEVDFFMNECFRVLKKDGVLRIAVPDLELITSIYLEVLKRANSEAENSDFDYEWIMLHLYDQSVRDKSGGGMREYLSKEKIENFDFIEKLMGSQARAIVNSTKETKTEKIEKLLRKDGFYQAIRQIFKYCFRTNPLKEILLKILLHSEYKALQIGRFRLNGEIHQWMYDKYSLKKIMNDCGLDQVVQCSAYESSIKNWNEFNLDVELNGKKYRPDSIYMEGIKL